MECDVATRLKKWADNMGYVHRNESGLDNTADFNRLCKNGTKPLWDKVIPSVKPLSQLDHIRKNILLSRKRKGTDHQSDLVLSGSLGQQVKLRHQLKELQQQKQLLLDKISMEEASIIDITVDMKKKYARTSFKENQLKEYWIKGEMLRIKKKDCESFKSWLDDVNTAAKNLCSLKAETPNHQGKDVATSALEKCMKVIEDYQVWCKESLDEEEHHAEQERRKQALWKAVTAIVGKVPSEQLWNSLLCNFVERSVSEMASLASSVDTKAELETVRESGTKGAKPNQDLSAIYIKSVVDTADHLVKTNVLSHKLDLVLEELADEAEACLPVDMNMTKTPLSPRDRILEWLRLRSRLVQLEAVVKALTDEVNEMKLKTRDLSSCAQRLKEERAAVACLDTEIAEVKIAVEQGLLSISDTENKLRKAQQAVLDELEVFAEKCTCAIDVVSNNSHDITLSTTTKSSAAFNSTALSTKETFTCSTPFQKAQKPSDCRELFRLDETGLTIDSIECIPPKQSFKEIVTTLRNAVSNESKSFFKLPLELVPKVSLPTSTEDISGLLVESPSLIARLSCAGGEGMKQLMLLSPSPMTTDSQMMLLHVFQNFGQLRAAKLQQLLAGCSAPTTLCAGMSQQYLKVTTPDQDNNIREQLSNIITVIENTEDGVAEGRKSFNNWMRRPVQGMLPDTLQLEGKTLKEWKTKYDCWVNQLR